MNREDVARCIADFCGWHRVSRLSYPAPGSHLIHVMSARGCFIPSCREALERYIPPWAVDQTAQHRIHLTDGTRIIFHTASSLSCKGLHPDILWVDEPYLWDRMLLYAAYGQVFNRQFFMVLHSIS